MSEKTYEEDFAECQQAAINAGALEPQGLLDRAAAGIMAYNRKKWSDTPQAQQRLRTMTNACLRRKGYDVGGFDEELADCQGKAVAAGTLKPQGAGERMASGIQMQNGVHWSDTPIAQQRYREFLIDCMREKGFDV